MDHYIIKVYPVNVDIDYAVQIAWKHGIELKEIEDETKKVRDCYEAEKSTDKGIYEFYLGIVNKNSIPEIAELTETELDGKLVFIINYSFFSKTEPFYKGISKEYIEKPYRRALREMKADFHGEVFNCGKLNVDETKVEELKEELKEVSRMVKALEEDVSKDDINEMLSGKESIIKWRCEKCGKEQTTKFLWEELESNDGLNMYGSTPLKCKNKKCDNVRLLVSYHSNIDNLMKKMGR